MRKYVLVSEIILFRFGGKVFTLFFFYELMGIFFVGSLMAHEIDKSGNPGLRCGQRCPQDQVEEWRPGQTSLWVGLMGPLGLPGM